MSSSKINILLRQRKAAIAKLQKVLKDSEEGKQALNDLLETAETANLDKKAFRDIVEWALITARESYTLPVTDSKEVQAFLFACGIESYLLNKGIIPPFVIKKGN